MHLERERLSGDRGMARITWLVHKTRLLLVQHYCALYYALRCLFDQIDSGPNLERGTQKKSIQWTVNCDIISIAREELRTRQGIISIEPFLESNR